MSVVKTDPYVVKVLRGDGIPKGTPCSNCKKRLATEKWDREGGGLAWVHGKYQYWCKSCVLKEQLAYAEKLAKKIPELKRELKGLGCG